MFDYALTSSSRQLYKSTALAGLYLRVCSRHWPPDARISALHCQPLMFHLKIWKKSLKSKQAR
jgi:hypothetical protein